MVIPSEAWWSGPNSAGQAKNGRNEQIALLVAESTGDSKLPTRRLYDAKSFHSQR